MKAILGHDDIFKTSIQLYVFLEKNLRHISTEVKNVLFSQSHFSEVCMMKGKCFPIIHFTSSSKHFNQSDFANLRRLLEKLQHSSHSVALLSFPWDAGSFTKTVLSAFHWEKLDQQHFPSSMQCNRYLDAASRNANLSLENEADALAMSMLHLRLLYPCSHCRLQGASRLLQGCPYIGIHYSYVRKRNQTFWLWKHFWVHICATLCV